MGVLLLTLSLAGWAEHEEESMVQSRQRLQEVLRVLKDEQSALRKVQGEERSLLVEWEAAERNLTDTRTQAAQLQRSRLEEETVLAEVERALAEHREEVVRQGGLLSAHLRLLYALGEEGLLKLVLGQANPVGLSQAVHYFGYVIQARQERLRAFQEAQDDMDAAVVVRQRQVERLQERSEEQEAVALQLTRRQEERTAWLEQVRADAAQHQGKVRELEQSRRELAVMAAKLDEALNQDLDRELSFGQLSREMGKLPKPVAAKAQEKPPGLFFRAPEASPVKAVYRGRVVYADWFRGYGLLMILDHGQHGFTLYGHNQRLLASQGDWVDAGEEIAVSGDSGSLEGPGVYFELRQGGRAVNARQWLAGRGS